MHEPTYHQPHFHHAEPSYDAPKFDVEEPSYDEPEHEVADIEVSADYDEEHEDEVELY